MPKNMNKGISVSVSIPKDDEGMIGRECPKCKTYFKITPGTGLHNITHCICPYCEHKDGSKSFTTKEQLDFAKSVAVKQVLGPSLQKLEDSFKKLERTTRHSLIQINVKGTGFSLPIKYYLERDLETHVQCDHCGLIFAVYGIFASCPDCNRLNSMSIFKKSIEASKKRLAVINNLPDSEGEIIENIIVDALSGGVAAFDGLGKRLKSDFPSIFPKDLRMFFKILMR